MVRKYRGPGRHHGSLNHSMGVSPREESQAVHRTEMATAEEAAVSAERTGMGRLQKKMIGAEGLDRRSVGPGMASPKQRRPRGDAEGNRGWRLLQTANRDRHGRPPVPLRRTERH